jgi:hypothetical protein
VRGTEFDFNVNRFNGNTELVMLGGMTRICPKDKTHACIEARSGCGMTIIPPGGGVSQLKASVARNQIINRDFKYIRNQAGLHSEFRVDTASCGNTSVSPLSPGSFQPISIPVPSPPPPPPPPPCAPGNRGGYGGGHTGTGPSAGAGPGPGGPGVGGPGVGGPGGGPGGAAAAPAEREVRAEAAVRAAPVVHGCGGPGGPGGSGGPGGPGGPGSGSASD